jgi:hypothetical protein
MHATPKHRSGVGVLLATSVAAVELLKVASVTEWWRRNKRICPISDNELVYLTMYWTGTREVLPQLAA